MTGTDTRPRLLIVGCGMATARLLQSLVARGHGYRIDVIGEEATPAYNRVLLSSLLAGDKQLADLRLQAAAWYAGHGIGLHTGQRLAAVDIAARVAVTTEGRRFHWDQLVFATGSRQIGRAHV